MKILTLDNKRFHLTNLPEELEEDVYFATLDNSNPKEPDFFFNPLIFLESFNSPAMVMNIDDQEIMMPVDWCIVVGDSESGIDLEVLPLTSINNRGFEAFLYNPISSLKPEFGKIKITNFYNDVKWYFPKLKNGQLLATPIDESDQPRCAYFIRDITKQNEMINYTNLF